MVMHLPVKQANEGSIPSLTAKIGGKMVKLWMKRKAADFVAAEWCPVCGFIDNNISFFAFGMCMGGKDGKGNQHKPAAMIRIRQKRDYLPPPRHNIFR